MCLGVASALRAASTALRCPAWDLLGGRDNCVPAPQPELMTVEREHPETAPTLERSLTPSSSGDRGRKRKPFLRARDLPLTDHLRVEQMAGPGRLQRFY